MFNNKSDTQHHLPDALYTDLLRVLEQHPDGLGEYELLQLLRESGYFAFMEESPASPQAIFYAHFLLFHALYQLQSQLLSAQQNQLEIGPLNIQLLEYRQASNAISQPDVLREYYLDLGNLVKITDDDINELLASFWCEFTRFDNRGEALAELGLSDPVDDTTIKQAYRRLAMECHPDRGGDKQRLQAINAAYDCLCKSRR